MGIKVNFVLFLFTLAMFFVFLVNFFGSIMFDHIRTTFYGA